MEHRPPPSSLHPAGAAPSMTEVVDLPLHLIGFEIEELTAEKVAGRLPVTEKCCQLFGVLHGGVSALIAEGLASYGAMIANGFQRVAGIQLSISHVKSAQIGDLLYAEATPFNVGRTLQVWDVHLWKLDPSNSKSRSLIASSRVTLFCNLPAPNRVKDPGNILRKYAKL
ncbi:hypothetical protein Dimus_028413 [Dionaea muscipula]